MSSFEAGHVVVVVKVTGHVETLQSYQWDCVTVFLIQPHYGTHDGLYHLALYLAYKYCLASTHNGPLGKAALALG